MKMKKVRGLGKIEWMVKYYTELHYEEIGA